MEHYCLDETVLVWIQDRLCAECGGDWEHDRTIRQLYCPVCDYAIDSIKADRVRKYGMHVPKGWTRFCLCCGYIVQSSQASEATRLDVFIADKFICVYCGIHPDVPTIDHVIPQARGGTHALKNLVTACGFCNASKNNRPGPQPRFGRFGGQT